MFRKSMTGVAIAVMAGAALAGDYFFPTAYPQGVDLDTVKQIVTFIWDDNAYSGLAKTDYELHPDVQENNTAFENHQWVGGLKPWETGDGSSAINQLGIQEGDMGMAWAISKLAGIQLPPAEWKPGLYVTDDRVIKDDAIYVATKRIEHSQKEFVALDPDTVVRDTTIIINHWPLEEKDTTLYWDDLADHERNAMMQANDWVREGEFILDQHPESSYFSNPDGSPIQFTFNVISGLFVPIIGAQDGNRVSKFGYWQPNATDLIEFPHLDAYKSGKLPIAWGREMPVVASAGETDNVNGEAYGRVNDVFKMTNSLGHEIGNHTVDHLESNSMLPNAAGPFPAGTNGEWYVDGFARWGGDGFAADHISPMTWGNLDTTASEVEEFGKTEGITWHSLGWEMYAGKTLSYAGWKGLIELGEEDLEIALGVTPLRDGGTVGSFRAPRLEVNGAMHYALQDLGYLYDCGLEEGYEYNIDGSNFYWPYTTDNGSPNQTWQRTIGENMSMDSLPAGFWQIPVNAMIVPEEIRGEVFRNYKVISTAEGHEVSDEDSLHWVNQSGKVTGFDFNMFILWGMTKDNALTTLKYNLDQRMAGGKAPMQIGCHTDYFTPIYDNATLLEEFNRSTYGLCVDNGWNDWEDRKAVFEDFIDYGLSKGAYFWSGAQTIEYVRKIAAADVVGTAQAFNAEWSFYKNENLGSTADDQTLTGSIDATINVAKEDGDDAPATGYATYFSAGALSGLDHISLNYNTSAPLAIKLIMNNDQPWEVWLNNLNNDVESGTIPLQAFHYNQYDDAGTNSVPNADDIIGIEIQVLGDIAVEQTVNFSISDFTTYRDAGSVGVSDVAVATQLGSFGVNGIVNNRLQLEVPAAGAYNIDIVTLDGRIVRSINSRDMTAGVNAVDVSSLANGVYLLNISNGQHRAALKAVIM